MEFWVTRDADTPLIESRHWVVPDGYFTAHGPGATLGWMLGGVYPATPLRPPEPQTFRVHAQRWGHEFTVWQSDGSHALFIEPNSWDWLAYAADTLTVWNGQSLYNPLEILTFTATIDPTRAWWLHDDTTGETFPVSVPDVLNGWIPLFSPPPPSGPVTVRLPYLRS